MKLCLFIALLGNLFLPWGVPGAPSLAGVLVGAGALAGKLLGLAALLALTETSVAKLRLFRVQELLSGSFVLALLSVASVFFVH